MKTRLCVLVFLFSCSFSLAAQRPKAIQATPANADKPPIPAPKPACCFQAVLAVEERRVNPKDFTEGQPLRAFTQETFFAAEITVANVKPGPDNFAQPGRVFIGSEFLAPSVAQPAAKQPPSQSAKKIVIPNCGTFEFWFSYDPTHQGPLGYAGDAIFLKTENATCQSVGLLLKMIVIPKT